MRPCPARTGDDLCPPSLPSAFRLLPPSQPAPPPGSKTTFLHGHYLFFVPFSFCKKQSQKPVQNHPSGRPVYITKALGDPRKGGVLAGGGRGRSALPLPRGATTGWGILWGPLGLDGEGRRCPGGRPGHKAGSGAGLGLQDAAGFVGERRSWPCWPPGRGKSWAWAVGSWSAKQKGGLARCPHQQQGSHRQN